MAFGSKSVLLIGMYFMNSCNLNFVLHAALLVLNTSFKNFSIDKQRILGSNLHLGFG